MSGWPLRDPALPAGLVAGQGLGSRGEARGDQCSSFAWLEDSETRGAPALDNVFVEHDPQTEARRANIALGICNRHPQPRPLRERARSALGAEARGSVFEETPWRP